MKFPIFLVALSMIGVLLRWPLALCVSLLVFATIWAGLSYWARQPKREGRLTGLKKLWFIPAALCLTLTFVMGSPLALFLAAVFNFLAIRQGDGPMPSSEWGHIALTGVTMLTLGVGVTWAIVRIYYGAGLEVVIYGIDHGTPAWHRFWGG